MSSLDIEAHRALPENTGSLRAADQMGPTVSSSTFGGADGRASLVYARSVAGSIQMTLTGFPSFDEVLACGDGCWSMSRSRTFARRGPDATSGRGADYWGDAIVADRWAIAGSSRRSIRTIDHCRATAPEHRDGIFW